MSDETENFTDVFFQSINSVLSVINIIILNKEKKFLQSSENTMLDPGVFALTLRATIGMNTVYMTRYPDII